MIVGTPKAILFSVGVLPGFFDLARLIAPHIAAILALSMAIPLAGNLVMALFVDRARRPMSSPRALARVHAEAGALPIGVGLVIPFV